MSFYPEGADPVCSCCYFDLKEVPEEERMNDAKRPHPDYHTIMSATIVPPKGFGDQAVVKGQMSDGTEVVVLKYFSDELSFSAEEFVGLTLDQALNLFVKRDTAYLRS
jgi:hypothetical protein